MSRLTQMLGNLVAWLLVWADIYADDPRWYRAPVWWVTIPILEVWLKLHSRYFVPAKG